MTAVTVPLTFAYAPVLPLAWGQTTSLGSAAAFTFDAAADKLAFVWKANTTAVPNGVDFFVQTFTSTGTLDATLETVDANGFPSGTLVTGSATGSLSVTATGKKTITGMAGTATISVGTWYAVVLTATTGFAGSFTVRYTFGSTGSVGGQNYAARKDSAGAWDKNFSLPTGMSFGIYDSGGTYLEVANLSGAFTEYAFQAYSDATNPDERGNRFNLPFPFTCRGALVFGAWGSAPTASNDFQMALYSSHTLTRSQLAVKAISGIHLTNSAARYFSFDTAVACAANTTYALALKATAAGTIQPVRFSYTANAELVSLMGETGFYSTTANNAGDFTDDNTRVYCVFPLISKLDDGAGGAGGGGRIIGG